MTPTSPNHLTGEAEIECERIRAERGRARESEKLAALPEDCQPEFRAPSTSFEELLRSLVGRTVTVVDPESYEEEPMGYRIRAAIYRAQLVAVGDDYVVLSSQFVHRGAGTKEEIRHHVPLAGIKRVSVLANQPVIHL